MNVATPLPERATVLGAGLMGAGIAQLLAEQGTSVSLYDIEAGALDRGVAQLDASLERLARAERLDEPVAEISGRVAPTRDLPTALDGSGLVIEAVPERLELKRELLAAVEPAVSADALLATNTSQLSITEVAAPLERPDRFLGLHFFNPPPVRRLVEVIPGLATAPEQLERGVAVARAMDCTAVVSKDVQGFVASRGTLALQLECYRLYEEGVASAEDIDTTFRLGFGHPMGPLELADYVGLDTILLVAESMHDAYGDRYRPPLILRRMVAAGRLGRKSGAGFYDYRQAAEGAVAP